MNKLQFDGIIIGAGPNGLTVGAYLAKAGLKVLVIDRRFEIGGGLSSEDVTLPGILSDTHAIYHMMVDYAPQKNLFYNKKVSKKSQYHQILVYPQIQDQ